HYSVLAFAYCSVAHRALRSFPTRRSSDLSPAGGLATDGDLGWVDRGKMDHALANVAFALQPGEISKPVEDAQGWNILQSVERKRSEEHTSELQSLTNLVCRLLLEKKK